MGASCTHCYLDFHLVRSLQVGGKAACLLTYLALHLAPVEIKTACLKIYLVLHYCEGGLPKALMEPVEEMLKGLGEWFPNPRLHETR